MEKHRFCITKVSPLIRCRQIIHVCSEDHAKPLNTGCCETADFLILKQTEYIINTGFCVHGNEMFVYQRPARFFTEQQLPFKQ
jgi:hypothetical protein